MTRFLRMIVLLAFAAPFMAHAATAAELQQVINTIQIDPAGA